MATSAPSTTDTRAPRPAPDRSDGSLVLFARDAGPAAALAGVANAGVRRGRRVVVLADGPGRAAFEREGCQVQPITSPQTAQEAERLLDEHAADSLVTGTSLHVTGDAAFWNAAERRGIRSLALLDHWRAYADRFTVTRPFDALPAQLAVMDRSARHGLARAGFPRERIAITGQPYFDPARQGRDVADRARARQELGIDAWRPVLLLISEPARAGTATGDLDQIASHEALAPALAWITRRLAREVPDALVLVKVHPRERVTYDGESSGDGVELRFVHDFSPWRLVSAADAVLGFASIMLLQAWAVGVPAFSFATDGPERHFLTTHAERIRTGRLELLGREIVAAVTGGPLPAPREIPFGSGAIDRVLALAHAA